MTLRKNSNRWPAFAVHIAQSLVRHWLVWAVVFGVFADCYWLVSFVGDVEADGA